MCPDLDKVYGKIINVQHFSVDDGPGIRTTVFLKGCPLQCAWCHNPESQSTHAQLLYRHEKCTGCGVCGSVCQSGVHVFHNGSHTVIRDACQHCGACTRTCYAQALEIAGKDIALPVLMEEILLDRVFYRRSGGGVTVSGGEPLAQAEFTWKLLRACKDEGIHTCVETCGFGRAEDYLQTAAYTDLFLFDYKLTDSKMHEMYTGVSNAAILENLDLLCRHGADIILRCPMIPEVNLFPSHYDGIAALAGQYPNIREIHLEPYHPLGVGKHLVLGRNAVYSRKEFLEKDALLDVQTYIKQKAAVEVKIL